MWPVTYPFDMAVLHRVDPDIFDVASISSVARIERQRNPGCTISSFGVVSDFALLNPGYVNWVYGCGDDVMGNLLVIARFLIRADTSTPIRRHQASSHRAVKRGIRPVAHSLNMAVLHWIEPDVFDVASIVIVVPNRVLPESVLPDASRARDSNAAAEAAFDETPTGRIVGIAFRQCPECVQVIGQHDHGVDGEWPHGAHRCNALAKYSDMVDERACAAISQRDSEEIRAARHAVPAVVNHTRASSWVRSSPLDRPVPDFASLNPGYLIGAAINAGSSANASPV